MAASVEFKVSDGGWADLSFHGPDGSVTLGVSDQMDPLGDLVRLALLAATCAAEGSFLSDGEGPEWRIEFHGIAAPGPHGPGQMQLTVWEGDGATLHKSEGRKIFRADYPTLDFARSVLAIANTNREAYVRSWGREDCPPIAIAALAATLAAYDA
jgi:hypothetical protein